MDRRLRILMFCPYLSNGGAERHMVRVANYLNRDMFEVSFVVLRKGGSYEQELAEGIRIHSLDTRMRWAIPHLARTIKRLRPAVVFSTTDQSNCAVLAACMMVRPRPVVVAGIAIAVTTNIANERLLTRYGLRLLIPWLYKSADKIVAPCHAVHDDLLTWLPELRGRTCVIYNAGVDDSIAKLRHEPTALPPASLCAAPVVVAIGRFVPQKGFAHLLDAIALLRRRLPVKLWLIGTGPLEDVLKARAHELAITDCVWFAGFRENPFALIKQANVFALSSLWEGFGLVVTEAMASGTPVVATDCPYGPSEIIRNEREGLLVPPGDPVALASALERVLTDPDLQQTMTAAGLRRAQDFSASKSASEHGELFQALTAPSERAR